VSYYYYDGVSAIDVELAVGAGCNAVISFSVFCSNGWCGSCCCSVVVVLLWKGDGWKREWDGTSSSKIGASKLNRMGNHFASSGIGGNNERRCSEKGW